MDGAGAIDIGGAGATDAGDEAVDEPATGVFDACGVGGGAGSEGVAIGSPASVSDGSTESGVCGGGVKPNMCCSSGSA